MENTSKILIVDDRFENLVSLERLLESPDIEFVRAFSGNEALKLTLHHDFALAIIDVQMPDMDGYETVELMRTAKKTKYLPVIFVSAIYREDFHIVKGIESGAVDFISKPIIPEILKGKVRVFLELYQQKKLLNELLIEQENTNKELEEAKKKAELATYTKSMFLANMSHEIRTPLNGVIGLSSILSKTELTAEQQELLELIIISGQNLLAIINDILDYSKIEAGQVQIERTPLSLRCELGVILKIMRFNAKAHNIQILHEIDSTVPHYIYGDPLRIKQILLNLLNNAIKFTEKGHVKLVCKLLQGNENMLRFEVSDTGIGINEEAKNKLFSEFTQADISTTRKYGGTGLGLAICKNLVKLMKGSIGAESVVGEGSVFWFQIPFEISPKPEKLHTHNISARIHSEIKILLAEDNPINQKVAIHALKQLNLKCDLATNGLEVIQMHKDNHYNLILMDIQMPEMDGLEASRKIREMEKAEKVQKPVLIAAVTANAFEEDKQHCIDAGMNFYLSKPFKIEALTKILADIR